MSRKEKLDVHGNPVTPGIDDEDPVENYRMPLLEHLVELRSRMIKALAAALVSVSVCLLFSEKIWAFLVAPMNKALYTTGRGTMAMTTALEGFVTMMKVAGVAGLIIASPVIFWQIWKFVAPGLYPSEKKPVLPLVIASSGLFTLGAAFGYFVIFEYAFPYFLEFAAEDVQAVLSIDAYLGMATKLLLAFGLCFQLPVVVYFLARIGLIDARDMISSFKYSVVAMFVIAAMITPPDVISQLLMAGPLLILYGVGIIIAWLVSTKKRDELPVAD
ncbi:MAG: twin-arginine translocase subunit TatC [Alphaproteobacteria bacterium]|nr:twin-arginine translocase subunit TatC [Alphaproteobacteria bacterium]